MKPTDKEKENQKVGAAISIGIHAIIALSGIFFVSCWERPAPPWPENEFGMLLNFNELDNEFAAAGQASVAESAPPTSPEAQPEQEEVDEVEEVFEESAQESEVQVEQVEEQPVQEVTNPQPDVVEVNPSTPTTAENIEEEVEEIIETDKPVREEVSQKPEKPATFENTAQVNADSQVESDNSGLAGDKPGGSPEKFQAGNAPADMGKPGGSNVSMNFGSWGFGGMKTVDKIRTRGAITFKLKIDDEGNIASIQPSNDTGAFTVEEINHIKQIIRNSLRVKLKGDIDFAPEYESGTITIRFT